MLTTEHFEDKADIWNNQSLETDLRRRTMDTIPVSSIIQADQITENKKLLQKLTKMIESKHLIIRQLERSEKSRIEQVRQLNRKVADLTTKMSAATSQYKREISEIKNQYECRIKKLQFEQQTLRRKHMQLMNKSDQARHQNQSTIDQLKRNVEKLTHEKKKMIKRLKIESDRARVKLSENEREVAKLKRQEAQHVSHKKRLERELSQQKLAHKRSTEEIVALGAQMKQIAVILKKASQQQKPNTINKNLLAKAIACANVRGYLTKQSSFKKVGGNFKVASLQQHVHQKKKMIHR